MPSHLKIDCRAFSTEMQKKEMLLGYLLSVFQLAVYHKLNQMGPARSSENNLRQPKK